METDRLDLEKTQDLFTIKDFSYQKKQTQNEHVNNLFNKRFVIAHNECYSLPKSKTLFKNCLWKIDKLQILKNELNSVKNNLNHYDLNEWHSHTKERNSAKNVIVQLRKNIQPEFVTQAWCKFYEIVSSFPLIPLNHIENNNKRFKSIHLCEAPGAFIASLNHWLKTNEPSFQWDWLATTLNPYYEGNQASNMIDDDRFIRHTSKYWCFGEDNTGNLMNLKNLNELVKLSEPRKDIFLITADGSIDCINDPAEQENIVTHIHFCETVAALHLLNTGGSFLLKMFTMFECHSVCLIYLLSCCFGNVSVVKPATSKEGNSETYVVCTDFKGSAFVLPYLEKFREHYECGPKQAMFCKDDIPYTFIEKIVECNEFFNSQQCLVIMNNIITFKSDNTKMFHDTKQIQHMVADKYIRDYNLKKLTSGEIIGKTVLRTSYNINTSKKALQGSYNERFERNHLTSWDQLQNFLNDSNRIQIFVSPQKVMKFKVGSLPDDLTISSGKIFHRICSSKFCEKNILNIKNGINDILVNMEYKIQFPPTENINKFKENIIIEPNYKLLIFQYTDIYDSHEIITKVYDALKELPSGNTLVLIGYSLLTHLTVGLLYLISYAFNSVELQLCNNIGLKITLKHYNNNLKMMKYLINIKTASSNAQEKGNAIFQIIHASYLYECDLFFTIMDANHWIIKSFVHYVFHTLEGNIQQ